MTSGRQVSPRRFRHRSRGSRVPQGRPGPEPLAPRRPPEALVGSPCHGTYPSTRRCRADLQSCNCKPYGLGRSRHRHTRRCGGPWLRCPSTTDATTAISTSGHWLPAWGSAGRRFERLSCVSSTKGSSGPCPGVGSLSCASPKKRSSRSSWHLQPSSPWPLAWQLPGRPTASSRPYEQSSSSSLRTSQAPVRGDHRPQTCPTDQSGSHERLRI